MNKARFGISVVIPVFNRKEKLIRAVDSVRTSNPGNVEIIIVDDCSDVSPETFINNENSYGIPIFIYKNFQNSGPQIARNLGIRRAKFSYIAFLDSDDYFLPDKVDWLLNELKTSKIDFLYHAVQGCEKYNLLSKIWFRSLGKIIHFRWFLCLMNPCVTPSVVIRKKICLFNPSLRYAEDYAFLLSYIDGSTNVKYYENIHTVVPREIGTIGGVSSNLVKMRKGELAGKKNLLRKIKLESLLRYFLSLMCSYARVIADLMRKRYTFKEFLKSN